MTGMGKTIIPKRRLDRYPNAALKTALVDVESELRLLLMNGSTAGRSAAQLRRDRRFLLAELKRRGMA